MRKLICAAVASLALVATAKADTNWYMGHVGPETCIAVGDYSFETGHRLYYGAGALHTPDDVKGWFISHGMRANAQMMTKEEITIVNLKLDGPGVNTTIVMFNNEQFCQIAMRNMKK
jgi:hypothetical protein